MKVLVYVEGPSDKQALAGLLEPLIRRKRRQGVYIQFINRGSKGNVVSDTLIEKALRFLQSEPEGRFVILPDLYPPNQGVVPHETVDELVNGVHDRFHETAEDWTVDSTEIVDRFHVFCLKYELEALILAAEEALRDHLDTDIFSSTWIHPVEDQNHDKPPEEVVREIFHENNEEYTKTVDAPEILEAAEHTKIAERCPQQFQPFVDLLTSLGEERGTASGA
jgi:hypothetical protein